MKEMPRIITGWKTNNASLMEMFFKDNNITIIQGNEQYFRVTINITVSSLNDALSYVHRIPV